MSRRKPVLNSGLFLLCTRGERSPVALFPGPAFSGWIASNLHLVKLLSASLSLSSTLPDARASQLLICFVQGLTVC